MSNTKSILCPEDLLILLNVCVWRGGVQSPVRGAAPAEGELGIWALADH